MDPGEDEEENPTLPVAAITTLQQSSKFKILFDQLGLTAKEIKIATEALVSSENFRKKDPGMPNGSDRVWRKG